MKGFIFLFLELGRRISRMGFAFAVLMAAIFSFIIGRFLAIRFNWVDATNALESSVEWASWLDFGGEILLVTPVILLAGLMAWGRYGSRIIYYDLTASQQRMYRDQWSERGVRSLERLANMLTIFGWLVIPLFGFVALYSIVQSIFGF